MNIPEQQVNRHSLATRGEAFVQFPANATRALWLAVNQRLAREIVRRYDADQLSAGAQAWHSIQALSWQAGMRWIFCAVREITGESLRLLSDAQALAVWERIVADSEHCTDLLDDFTTEHVPDALVTEADA